MVCFVVRKLKTKHKYPNARDRNTVWNGESFEWRDWRARAPGRWDVSCENRVRGFVVPYPYHGTVVKFGKCAATKKVNSIS